MAGECKICGCTELNLFSNLCSACVVEVHDVAHRKRYLVEKDCRFCALLIDDPKWEALHSQKIYTCIKGRFDEPEIAEGGHHWYAWSGIWRGNKKVRSARKHCPHFIPAPQVWLRLSKRAPQLSV